MSHEAFNPYPATRATARHALDDSSIDDRPMDLTHSGRRVRGRSQCDLRAAVVGTDFVGDHGTDRDARANGGHVDSGVLISADDADHVLWHFGQGGYAPGSFTKSLMTAIAVADSGNRDRLRAGFPELVHAMELALRDIGGIARLTEIASGL